jgi:hypothetical protein
MSCAYTQKVSNPSVARRFFFEVDITPPEICGKGLPLQMSHHSHDLRSARSICRATFFIGAGHRKGSAVQITHSYGGTTVAASVGQQTAAIKACGSLFVLLLKTTHCIDMQAENIAGCVYRGRLRV